MSDDPSLSSTAEELRSAVGEFVRTMRVHDSMPPGQAAVLGHLDRVGELSIADLARREQVRHQSMTRTVALLREQGFVVVSPAAADRRQVVVALTERGRRRLTAERDHRASGIAHAIEQQLDEEERAILTRIPAVLRKLQAHATRRPGLP